MNLTKKIVSAVAAGSMVLSLGLPVLANTGGTEIIINGNGAASTNYADVNQTSTTTTTQNNVANVTNNVDSTSSTGGNSADFNTSGTVSVLSGSATSSADVVNILNTNTAEVDCCGANNANVEISNNGVLSTNTVDLDLKNTVKVNQDNMANVTNNVDADAYTGYNHANGNTGDGVVTVVSGNASSAANVATVANTNSAMVGPGQPGGSTVSAVITGNGAGTKNWIKLGVNKSAVVDQDNLAYVTNNVDADAYTGLNKASFNTGADVLVGSGAATSTANVLNDVNHNFAKVDCGCVTNVLAKIAENGGGYPEYEWGQESLLGLSDFWYPGYIPASSNTIIANLNSTNSALQDNLASLANNVDAESKTGKNGSTLNTGDTDGDPIVVSGPASSTTTVVNEANTNVSGDFAWPMTWPWEDMDMEVSMNFQALWLSFMGMVNAGN